MAGAFSPLAFGSAFQTGAPPRSPFGELMDAVDRRIMAEFQTPTAILYSPASGPAVLISGVFRDPFTLVQGSEEAGVEATDPSVFLELADLPINPEIDDPTLTIGGTRYRVTKRRPAGFGAIVLELRKT